MLREADYGYRPKGLAYGMNMMKGYLHGSDPIECLKIWKHFDVMREGAENGYFENIIKKAILENDFSTFVEVRAKEGMQAEADRKEKEGGLRRKLYRRIYLQTADGSPRCFSGL